MTAPFITARLTITQGLSISAVAGQISGPKRRKAESAQFAALSFFWLPSPLSFIQYCANTDGGLHRTCLLWRRPTKTPKLFWDAIFLSPLGRMVLFWDANLLLWRKVCLVFCHCCSTSPIPPRFMFVHSWGASTQVARKPHCFRRCWRKRRRQGL